MSDKNHKIDALHHKVQAIIYGDRRHSRSPLTPALHGASLIYGALSQIRNTLYQKRVLRSASLPCKVVSVGNLTLGGTGKTPMVTFLSGQVQKMGLRPVVVSRGYKGLGEKRGRIVSNGHRVLCSAKNAGDEPYLIARLLNGVPVVIGQDRLAAGQTAVAHFKPDVVILDDAYQHQRLHRDLNLLLLDANAPFGNGHLLPRGPLRESCSAMSRADGVIFTRCNRDHYVKRQALEAKVPAVPVFMCSHRTAYRGCVPAGKAIGALKLGRSSPDLDSEVNRERLFAFSGLAGNSGFQASLRNNGWTLAGATSFNDHHPYSLRDLEDIVSAARLSQSSGLVTTDKDFVRLPVDWRLPLNLFVVGVEIDFQSDQPSMSRFLERLLS